MLNVIKVYSKFKTALNSFTLAPVLLNLACISVASFHILAFTFYWFSVFIADFAYALNFLFYFFLYLLDPPGGSRKGPIK